MCRSSAPRPAAARAPPTPPASCCTLLQFDFPSPSPAPSPSKPQAPTDACATAYNAVVDGDTGACRDGAKLSDCCAALSGLGKTCLESVYEFMKATPEDNAKAFDFL